MPKIIRVALTPEQRGELRQWARQRELAPRVRDRLEMVRQSDLGRTIPQIARELRLHEQTVRKYLTAFLADGFAALPDRPRPGRPPTVTAADLDAVVGLLDEGAATGRSWTLPQLARWLGAERGASVSTGHLRALLRRRRCRWKRTVRTVRHKQRDPDLQAAKAADLDTLTL
jgi:transposase